MPGRDGTGPYGMGPNRGRGFSPCGSYPIAPNSGCGMGFGRGRGYPWMTQATGAPGWMRYGYPAVPETIEPAKEKALLENQVKFWESQLEQARNQLKKLEE